MILLIKFFTFDTINKNIPLNIFKIFFPYDTVNIKFFTMMQSTIIFNSFYLKIFHNLYSATYFKKIFFIRAIPHWTRKNFSAPNVPKFWEDQLDLIRITHTKFQPEI